MTLSRTSSLPELTQITLQQDLNLRPAWQFAIAWAQSPKDSYTADVTVRGQLPPGSSEDGSLGPTVIDLASEDRALLLLLRAHQRLHTAQCDIEEAD